METLELAGSNPDAIRAAVQAELRGYFGALPAGVTKDGDGHNVSAKPFINALVPSPDGIASRLKGGGS
jgi:hypothetical protein